MAGLAEVTLRGCWSADGVVAHLDANLIPLRLAVHDSTGAPWVMSLWFLHEEGVIWCATDARSKLASYLEHQSICGFEVAGDQPPYRGIRGKGHVALVPERGGEILGRLLDRYGVDRGSRLARSLLAKADHEVAIRITPRRISSWDFTERMRGALPSLPG